MIIKYTFHLSGKPQGKQRHVKTKSGISFTPKQTVLAENWIRLQVMESLGWKVPDPFPADMPVRIHLEIFKAIPASWPKRDFIPAVMGTRFPTNKPDYDNVAKTVGDALNGILWMDDSQIVSALITKHYALESFMRLHVESVN